MSKGEEIISIVYMVAGLSSRFGGKVKQFAHVGPNEETLIEISMNQALKAGFDKIIFIVGEKTEKLFKEKFGFEYKGIPIAYAMQTFNTLERDRPWGTCDAVVSAKDVIVDKFVVCNGDDLYGENTFKLIYNWLSKEGTPVTAGYVLGSVLPEKGLANRGILLSGDDGCVASINEIIGVGKENLSEFGLTDRSVSSQNIFGLRKEDVLFLEQNLFDFKEKNKGDRRSECYLPCEVSRLIKDGKLKMKLLKAPDEWMGVTNPEDEITLRNLLKDKKE